MDLRGKILASNANKTAKALEVIVKRELIKNVKAKSIALNKGLKKQLTNSSNVNKLKFDILKLL